MAKEKKLARPVPEGHVALLAPAGASAVSVGGQQLAVNEDGTIHVPVEHAKALEGHGFVRATPDA